jgi:uncharacterized membrane protein
MKFVHFKENLLKSLLTAFSFILFYTGLNGFNFLYSLILFVIILIIALTSTNSVDLILNIIEKKKELKNA